MPTVATEAISHATDHPAPLHNRPPRAPPSQTCKPAPSHSLPHAHKGSHPCAYTQQPAACLHLSRVCTCPTVHHDCPRARKHMDTATYARAISVRPYMSTRTRASSMAGEPHAALHIALSGGGAEADPSADCNSSSGRPGPARPPQPSRRAGGSKQQVCDPPACCARRPAEASETNSRAASSQVTPYSKRKSRRRCRFRRGKHGGSFPECLGQTKWKVQEGSSPSGRPSPHNGCTLWAERESQRRSHPTQTYSGRGRPWASGQHPGAILMITSTERQRPAPPTRPTVSFGPPGPTPWSLGGSLFAEV